MRKFFKWTGIILLLLIGIMMIYAVLGLKQTVNLKIENIDLMQIPDGTYSGNYDSYRWSNEVQVTLKEHQIIDIQTIKIQDGRDSLIATLTQNILNQQRSDVDAISGATASSNAFLKAVETALVNGMTNH
ncbi:MAG: FMN-binding protein [Clostridia bacterium]|nr:FMN-binding protein [Clostridia bacterium]